MQQSFMRQQAPAIAVGLLDVFAIGLGMGVPFFAIPLGFGVGWWLARRQAATAYVERAASGAGAGSHAAGAVRAPLRALLGQALALVGVTLATLLVVWGPHIPKAFDPAVEAADWGIPLILYTSQPSVIGWLVLMLVISPALQFMAVVTGGVLGLAATPKRPKAGRA
jgi:hypothetical protein